MLVRKFSFCLVLACFMAAIATGCKKSGPQQPTENPQTASQPPNAETVARIHWLGKRRLATETNAASLMSIWAMPESQKIEAQTLDKLALAPWDLPRKGTNTAAIVATNANSLLLRPLLEDLLQEECYLEIRSGLPGAGSTASRPAEIALAIRLDDSRSQLWKTNLTAVFDSLTNHASLITNHPTFVRAGDWTIIGPAHGQAGWIDDWARKLGQNNNPFPSQETNSWLNTELDLNGISAALGLDWQLPANIPKVSLTMGGKGDHVRTTGRLNFREPLKLDLEPWTIPTNLVHSPLESFTAIRGIRPLLATSKIPAFLRMTTTPNQFFLWSQSGLPFQTYAAVPYPNSSNYVHDLQDFLENTANPWLTNNSGLGELRRTTNVNKMKWTKIPYLEPFFESVSLEQGEFISAGFGPTASTNHPMPFELLSQVMWSTNLVAYDWELSGPRLDDLLYLTQIMRAAVHRPQLPTTGYFIPWFAAIATNLGNSGMTLTLTASNQLSFVRTSTIGFSALELHFLADWLESPQFPAGLHTFLAAPDQPIHLPAGAPK
jgi:hypothetical protein